MITLGNVRSSQETKQRGNASFLTAKPTQMEKENPSPVNGKYIYFRINSNGNFSEDNPHSPHILCLSIVLSVSIYFYNFPEN